MKSMRENLLGYVLGALEPAEMAAIERDLDENPALRKELKQMQRSLLPLGFPAGRPDFANGPEGGCDDDFELDGPPVGLAEKTCAFVEETEHDLREAIVPTARLSEVSRAESAGNSRRLSWADWIVAASVLLAAGTLLFPAIASSRHAARVTACQNNLRELGLALEQYSDRSPAHSIPAIPLEGKRSVAGIYSVALRDAGLISDDHLVVCPGSELAAQRQQQATFAIPTLAQIDAAVGETLILLHRTMGGNYGYNLGYMDDVGRHHTPRLLTSALYPLMSDAPTSVQGIRKSRNHSSLGHNLLYSDSHVGYVVDLPDTLHDDPFHNRSGMIAAGEDQLDVVLGESSARPMPVFFQPLK